MLSRSVEAERGTAKSNPPLFSPRDRDPCFVPVESSVETFDCSFPVFGFGLCTQFDVSVSGAPVLVERCTRALEEKANADKTLDLYKVYHSSPPNEQTLELRKKLNEGKAIFVARVRLLPAVIIDYLSAIYQSFRSR